MSEFYAKCHIPSEQETIEYKPAGLEHIKDLSDYWMKRSGFVFMPFDEHNKGYFFSSNEVFEEEMEFLFSENDDIERDEYMTSVLLAQQDMKEGKFEKVVLARNEKVESVLKPEEVFERALELHSDSYCYMVDLGYEQWVGASPELLLHFENDILYTVALAGTRKLDEVFTEKESEEQHMVERFIEERLNGMGVKYNKSEKHEAIYGEIKHLKTAYTAHCSQDQALALALELQPTSAVCGLPRKQSLEFINDYENLNRSFYSGLVGIMDESRVTLFVNLRCMRFVKDGIELFAGAGITAKSNAEEEWAETERKLAAIKALLD